MSWVVRVYDAHDVVIRREVCRTEREMHQMARRQRENLGGRWSSETGGILHYRQRQGPYMQLGEWDPDDEERLEAGEA